MWVLLPSGHSGTLDPSGKKQALPEKTPTSSSGMSARNTPGSTSGSGMSIHARAIGVSPRSVSAMISRRRMCACPMFVRKAARPGRGPSSFRVTARTSPLHLRRKSCGLGVCVISLKPSSCSSVRPSNPSPASRRRRSHRGGGQTRPSSSPCGPRHARPASPELRQESRRPSSRSRRR